MLERIIVNSKSIMYLSLLTNAFDYFEGLSLTHGSPRQHVWTYAVGLSDSGSHPHDCPCVLTGGQNPKSFVGSHYYCESGAGSR